MLASTFRSSNAAIGSARQTCSAAPRNAAWRSVTCRSTTAQGGRSARTSGVPRKSVIDLIAASVEANARVALFEKYAGRSAMIGFSIALLVEQISGAQGLFGGLGVQEGNLYALLALLSISISAALAANSTKQLGRKFTEAVLTSMTAVQRSKGSVSMRNVDNAVDFVLDDVFSSSLLTQHLVEDDRYL